MLVKPAKTKTKSMVEKAKLGRSLLIEKNAVVSYAGKNWDVGELLEYLANKVVELRKNQCNPSTACIFAGEEFILRKTGVIK